MSKCYAWLDVNTNTPIEVKLMVLDNCVFGAILYGVESWGDISCIENTLKEIEMKALKSITRVKTGTTNDLIFHELRRCNIVSKIKDRQRSFYKKLSQIPPDEAVVCSIMNLCKDSNIIGYYSNLTENYGEKDKSERETKITQSSNSMCRYYCNMNFRLKCCIYDSMFNDYYRYIITRWRLSNHDLTIETGRYTRPIIPRDERNCVHCNILADEFHAIFICPLYDAISVKGRGVL